MRWLLYAIGVLALATVAIVAYGANRMSDLFPPISTEIVQLTEEKRRILGQLRAEHKFRPNEYPPLGYTGMATPEDEAIATKAVNGVIDAVLHRPYGPVPAKFVSDEIGSGMKKVEMLETEDRDQTSGFMLEIWYRLGFKGATGRFAYGAAFVRPSGYGEPLPPGWKSPGMPRPIRLTE